MRIIHSQNNPQHTIPQVLPTDSIVEKAGYISAGKRIENLILSGLRLDLARKEQFDTMDLKNEPSIVPSRRMSYDMAEASQDRREVFARLQEQAEAAKADKKAKDEAEALKKASQSPVEGSQNKKEG